MTIEFVDVDVRPILRAGGEPFSVIMQAVEGLQPGQGVRLFATFKPIPLFGVMGSRGFSHEAIALDDGEWEVLFRPAGTSLTPPPAASGEVDAAAWPSPRSISTIVISIRRNRWPGYWRRPNGCSRARCCLRCCCASRAFCSPNSPSAAIGGAAASIRSGRPTRF